MGWGLPRWRRGKEPACQRRGCRRLRVQFLGRKARWSRSCQPAQVFRSAESHGPRSLEDCSPWDREKANTTEHAHRRKPSRNRRSITGGEGRRPGSRAPPPVPSPAVGAIRPLLTSFFLLVSFQGALPSRAFSVCVCVCVCVCVARAHLSPCADAQRKGSHVGGVGRVPQDLRPSGSQSKPHGRAEARPRSLEACLPLCAGLSWPVS